MDGEKVRALRGPIVVTKNARDLRMEYIDKKQKNAPFSQKHLTEITLDGLTAELRLTDEFVDDASTEVGADDDYEGDSDDSDLPDEDRLKRAFRRMTRLMC